MNPSRRWPAKSFYKGFIIEYDPPPIPVRSMDWCFYHRDFDGAKDSQDCRLGREESESKCMEAIDRMLILETN